MPSSKARTVVVLLFAGIFAVMGGLFVAFPRPSAAFYGNATADPDALFYVRAVGLRDLALSAYLAGLALAGQRRALSILLSATLLIPMGDLFLLMASGSATMVHYALHGISLLCFAVLAWWHRCGGAW